MEDSEEIASSCLFFCHLGVFQPRAPTQILVAHGPEGGKRKHQQSRAWVSGRGYGWIMCEVSVGEEAQKIIQGFCV